MPDGLVERLVLFGHELRAEGLSIGSGDVMTFCAAAAALNPGEIQDLYWSGRTTMVTRRDQIPVYDRVFRRFFLDQSDPPPDEPTPPESTDSSAVLQVPDNERGTGEEQDDTKITLGLVGADAEIWRHKSFSACTASELRALRRIMARIRLTPPQRRSRRRVSDKTRGRPDMRRTVRETMRMHREPPRLFWTGRKLRIRPLVLILDVSGSMSDYSRNLLQFAYSTRRAAGRVEVFCFGTRLTRITSAIDRRLPDDALKDAAREVFDWDGGTRIGESLDEFVRHWGRLSRGSIVVICSDGLDRGDPAVLATAMERLARLSHHVVWMNPHMGDDEDFRPNTLGMMAAAPSIDTIVSGHNLRSLEKFAARVPELR
ncbi:MAG: VWA domain-containing protein, partial [Acidimicrobiia bacterium]